MSSSETRKEYNSANVSTIGSKLDFLLPSKENTFVLF